MINIEKILEELLPQDYPAPNDGYPTQWGYIVPRVTHILSEMLHEQSIVEWSNYIGMFKRQKYKEVINLAADIGTATHSCIENHIKAGEPISMDLLEENISTIVNRTYNSFLKWWSIISTKNITVLMQEVPLICQWFGGTLDLLINIDGRIVLVDFKTSNHFSYKYLLQLSAYRWMLRCLHNINVDTLCIVRLDKNVDGLYEEFTLDLNEESNTQLMNHCESCFASLVNGYYERMYIEKEFKERMKTNVL